ncbi:MAG: hypothetical protein QXU67_03220 [Candidatus Bathyarchaeia archaeon]
MIAMITAYAANNVLELQMQAAEFDNAKTGMRLLMDVITDVGLRHGSGSSVRFNSRAGRFNVIEMSNGMKKIYLKVELIAGEERITLIDTSETLEPLLNITYGGGTYMSTLSPLNIGTNDLKVESTSMPLGWLRTRQENGAWIKLDFNRVRIIPSGIVNIAGTNYYCLDIAFIQMIKGDFSGAYPPTLNVKVQNVGIDIDTVMTEESTIKIKVSFITEDSVIITEESDYSSQNSEPIVVNITKAMVSISITGG